MKKEDSVFKAYDVRGEYPSQINEALNYRIGRAFAYYCNRHKYYVGYDNRVHSERLAFALRNGIRDQGADVIDLGQISTPMLYLASKKEAALMVTASHLPKQYNGIKFMDKGVKPVAGNSLKKIEKIVLKNNLPDGILRGRLTRKSILSSYLKHVLSFVKDIKRMNVIVDGGNGMAGLTIPKIVENLPITIKQMHMKLDGSYPNHTPNPILKENIKDLVKAVKKQKPDFGVSFDGDMDRIVFVDEKARVIPADIMLGLFAQYEIRPNDTVVYDLRTSHSVVDAIRSAGGKPAISKVGRSNLVNNMREKKAVLGGELSGHYYFKQNFCVESADIAFIKLLNILSKNHITLSELVDPLFKYERSGELNFKVTEKKKALETIAKEFKDGKHRKLDGLTVTYEDAWFNVRPSHTEPILRVVIEADTKKRLDELKKRLKKTISSLE